MSCAHLWKRRTANFRCRNSKSSCNYCRLTVSNGSSGPKKLISSSKKSDLRQKKKTQSSSYSAASLIRPAKTTAIGKKKIEVAPILSQIKTPWIHCGYFKAGGVDREQRWQRQRKRTSSSHVLLYNKSHWSSIASAIKEKGY